MQQRYLIVLSQSSSFSCLLFHLCLFFKKKGKISKKKKTSPTRLRGLSDSASCAALPRLSSSRCCIQFVIYHLPRHPLPPQRLQPETCCWQLEPSQSSIMALRCLCRWFPPSLPLPPWNSLKGQPKAPTVVEINTNETIICGRQVSQLSESGRNGSLSLSCFCTLRSSTSRLSVVHVCV